MKLLNKNYIWLLPLSIILFKWILIFYFYKDFDFDTKIFANFNDLAYFPFIVSLSDFNIAPAYSDYFKPTHLITFPLASTIVHSIFYKIFGLASYVFLEIFFVIAAYFLIYFFAKTTKVNGNTAVLGTLFFFSLPAFLEYLSIFETYNLFLHIKDQIFNYHLFEFRYPRPLVSNLFFYGFLIFLLKFYNSNNPTKSNYVFLSILLSLILQSFIYLFILSSLCFGTFLFIKVIKDKDFIQKNIKNFIIFSLIFILFSLPFFFQLLLAEADYSARMGLFHMDHNIKKNLLIKTFHHFLNLKYLILVLIFIIFYFIFKKLDSQTIESYKFYLIIFLYSVFAPFIFIIISPYLIWFKHFFDVKNLIFLIGNFLIFIFIIDLIVRRLEFKKWFFSLIFVFLLIINSIQYYNLIYKNKFLNNDYLNDFEEIIHANKLLDSEEKINIFSNSKLINNYYTHKKQNILFPNGFHVSLNDNQLEILMINSFKAVGFNQSNFKNFIQNKINWRSENNIGQITGYKYQFNSFYTYFDLGTYGESEIKFLKQNKIFLSESIALSENEIKKLSTRFQNHKVIPEIKPKVVIFDKRENYFDFTVSDDYSEIINNKSFVLYSLKK